MGDPAGIGPEVVSKAAMSSSVRRRMRLVVFGRASLLSAGAKGRGSAVERVVEVSVSGRAAVRPRPGKGSGEASFQFFKAATEAVNEGELDALVTAPISKELWHRAGHRYDGHTEFLSKYAGTRATMMLAGKRLRVVLVTTHVALADVPKLLKTGDVVRSAQATIEHLKRFHGIKRPRLAVAALNPHAGEGGAFGDEESRVIRPAVARLKRARHSVFGPFSADTLFAAASSGEYDAVICMYHDQGLIPIKLLDFSNAVNVSMGLPFIRTSPDHGTAFDLAGKGKADPRSMIEALLMAAAMTRQRR